MWAEELQCLCWLDFSIVEIAQLDYIHDWTFWKSMEVDVT